MQMAEKTLVVSLPTEWLRRHKVEKGHSVEVQEKGAYLIVAPEHEQTPAPLRIDITGIERSVKRIIGGAYKAGFDEIEITYSTPAEFESVKKTLEVSLKTYEIVERKDGFARIKNLSEIRVDEFEQVLRRLFLLLLESLKELNAPSPPLDVIIERDLEVNNCADFCRRLLNHKGYVLYAATPALYYIVEQLEKSGDLIRDCAKLASSEAVPMQEVVHAQQALRGFYDLYYQFDLVRFDAWLTGRQDIGQKKSALAGLLSTLQQELYAANGALLVCKLSLEQKNI